MALTLLRHAPLPMPYYHRYNGWSDISIDANLFNESKIKLIRDKVFDSIFSSDLKRCKQTLERLNRTFITDTRLREVKFRDEIEGKSFDEIEKLESFDSKYLENETTWHNYICEESQQTFMNRIEDFLATLPYDKEILVCAHAGTIESMLKILKQPRKKIDYLEYIEVPYELQ